MREQKNSEVYKYPENAGQEQEERMNKREENKAEQIVATNPNPAANENIKDKNISTNENFKASQAGSEITDGEDG